MQWRLRPAALALAGAFLALAGQLAGPLGAAPTAAQRQAAPADGPDPVDFAVVVDQSESLAPEDLAREVEAAALIAQGEISERSRATVIGFGSSEKPGQSPVREVCPRTVADAAGRQRLSDCVQQLTKRDSRVGPGTDFPSALRQAVTRLTEDGRTGTHKVVFLLTDGRLDVSGSPEYGSDPASRQANGAKRLTDELARARAASVQIWPLGFGEKIDRAALRAMAAGGYTGGCADRPETRPKMRVLKTSAGIDRALQETFAHARCAQFAPGDTGRPPADLTVTIPPIATDGSLTVAKHDPKVTVTYFDPLGRKVPVRDTFDGSSFELSGQDGPVEALRVTNPLPGRWRVHIEAPEGHRDREVGVSAIWQGKLRSAVTLDPASPRAGEKAVIEVRMQTRRGVVITDPGQLSGIEVRARLAGDGFAPVTVPLADDGKGADRKAGDVRYTGFVTVPAGANGDLELTTLMSAPGVTSDLRPLHARTTQGTPQVTAGLTVDRAAVHPGDTLRGTLDLTNNDTAPHTLRLALEDIAPGVELRVEPATVTAPPGKRKVDFTVTVGAGSSPVGELGGQVAVLDADDDGRTLDTAFLEVRVEAPPTWWEKWWGAVLGGVAVLLLLGAFLGVRIAARRRRRDLTGLRLVLSRDGRELDSRTIHAGQSAGGEYWFTVDDVGGAAPTLRRSRSGAAGAHRLRRTGGGELLLRAHRGRDTAVRAGDPVDLGDDCTLVVQGVRPAGRRTTASGPSRLLGLLTGLGRRGRPPGPRDPRGGWTRPGNGDRDRTGDRDRDRSSGGRDDREPGRTPPRTDEHPAGAGTWDPDF
ncbi:vWA domain-containing protein [Streptomyces sp. HUAS MG47]|uniref:VWA domain-containing protein n=1 Tax=Streptomyces solicamelliae TaxID=3231716 RepID=UPI0038779F6B